MKTNQIVSRCILAGVFVYLIFQIIYLSCYLLPYVKDKAYESIVVLFIVQSVLFATAILSVFIVSFLQYQKKKRVSPFEAMFVISSEGKIKSRILLHDKYSFKITGRMDGKEVFIEDAGETKKGRYLYGICNLISGRWYFTVSSGSRPVGLKRGEESVIYRLKPEIPYQLSECDIIYADTCKIIVKQQKYLGESKWV